MIDPATPARRAQGRSAAGGSPPPSPAQPANKKLQNILVLQGGGALGAYQLGVCEVLGTAGFAPDWIAGVSIGAINGAIIAGNPPETCLTALRRFWDGVGRTLPAPWWRPDGAFANWFSEGAATFVAAAGVPGFFTPRFPPPPLRPDGTEAALSWYDTAPLRDTLDGLIDWDRLNDGPVRLSVGAVNVTTGNARFFDTRGAAPTRLTADHILASGALPPGFPPVMVEGEAWWDGGLVSNTPLQHVLDCPMRGDMRIFQVDVFPARGPMPRNLAEAAARVQDIRYSSRTRLATDSNANLTPAKAAIRRLLAAYPDTDIPERALLADFAAEPAIEIALIIYRAKAWNGDQRGYDFSQPALTAHRTAGHADATATLAARNWHAPPATPGIQSFDAGATPRAAPPAAGTARRASPARADRRGRSG
ncbi:patatin-like phospholipase family protein [Sandaracinobacteroides saxicola]|uniref:Patatin-like phospholipase family protein n=1 Tax=Sandaracinobacteroides saxicola TaxID=2759707 RepID=A0A7G5IHU1_9SPHN|nr:patatin-like phospholipase family protein [Sandaracinobacteroides saxicola]QMW22933.1 patatin-like phospholipase family protein [Sandaracinobacteroides saxicola]